MYEDGSCDLSIISNTIKSIKDTDPEKIVVIKSTVVPGTVQKLIDSYDENIIFNPEFLTEANAANDFEMQDRIILGGYGEALRKCEEFFKHYFQNSKIILCSPTEAELVKYVTNTFLTTKVAYANEIYNICKSLEVDFNNLSTIFTLDKRLGESHWSVPGPDGKYGYGGSCFPKDINALIYFANSINVATPVLNTVWKRNIEIDRPEQDWKGLVGRAVSKKKMINLNFIFKRVFDILISLFLIITLSPFLLLISLSIFLEIKENPIFYSIENGKNLKKFKIFKFKTMYKSEDGIKNFTQVKKFDTRVTIIGNFLRKKFN